MMHGFMELNDGTQIVHSDVLYDDFGKEFVKVYIEKPIHLGFKSAYCILPTYRWEKIEGLTDKEIQNFDKIIKPSELSI